jgi:hypothetical protein
MVIRFNSASHMLAINIIPVDRLGGMWAGWGPGLQQPVSESLELQIPPDLARKFWIAVTQIYHNPDDAPLMLCIDTSSRHLSRAQRRLEIDCRSQLDQDQATNIYLDLMVSAWILETLVKPRSTPATALPDIQEAESNAPVDIESLVLRLSEVGSSYFYFT